MHNRHGSQNTVNEIRRAAQFACTQRSFFMRLLQYWQQSGIFLRPKLWEFLLGQEVSPCPIVHHHKTGYREHIFRVGVSCTLLAQSRRFSTQQAWVPAGSGSLRFTRKEILFRDDLLESGRAKPERKP
jgi:hypothetical protein